MLFSIHSKALVLTLTAEKMAREEMERRKILVPKEQMIELGRRTLGEVARRLKRLAGESGPQCNPDTPLMAVKVLERAVNEILLAAQKATQELNAHGERD
jgi:hypothetical protein